MSVHRFVNASSKAPIWGWCAKRQKWLRLAYVGSNLKPTGEERDDA